MVRVKNFNDLPEAVKKKLRSLNLGDRNRFMTALSEGRLGISLSKKLKRKKKR